jgi:hypothetical protein
MDNIEFLDSPIHLRLIGHTTQHSTVHTALSGDRVRRREVDIGRLFQESDLEMELLGNSLGRRVCVTWPHDIFYIKTFPLP